MMFHRPKYNNKKIEIDGKKFASKVEADVYLILKEREVEGDITKLILHPRYDFFFGEGRTSKDKICSYISDFELFHVKHQAVYTIEVKGFKTDVYKLKKKMFSFWYPQNLFLEVSTKAERERLRTF